MKFVINGRFLTQRITGVQRYAREIVSVWAGHAADSTMTSNVYTHFSREFMLKEAEKVIYNL